MNKRWHSYGIYTLTILLLILASAGFKQADLLKPGLSRTLNSMAFYVILTFFLHAFCGAVFGLNSLIGEFKKKGKWSVQISRLVILGIPGIVVGLYSIFYYYVLPPYMPDLYSLSYLDFPVLVTLMRMLFGFAVITSFHKKEA